MARDGVRSRTRIGAQPLRRRPRRRRTDRKPPYEYEIHTIGVDKAFHGEGIGRGLLNRLLEIADGSVVFLEVRTDNAAAIGLYESVGFTRMGLRKRYYRVSGADAYTMRREAEDTTP